MELFTAVIRLTIHMLTFTYTNGTLTAVHPLGEGHDQGAINRNDILNMAHAEEIAADATALTGRLHVAADKGSHTSPRYDVIEAPTVGSEVSRGFNGDYYPAGQIIKVSKSLRRVETSDGTVFFRLRQTASWRANGTWYMTAGTHNERNPSF